VADRVVEVRWSFRSLPADCPPAKLQISIVANVPHATPTGRFVTVSGLTGSVTLRYPDFLPPPDLAIAHAWTRDGRPGGNARILITQ
jgi:hypothetical protein